MQSFVSVGPSGPVLRRLGEEGLCIVELGHRTQGEIAAILAALNLLAAARGRRSRQRLLRRAIERTRGFSEVCRLLAEPIGRRIDAGAAIERLCVGLTAGREAVIGSSLVLDVPRVQVDGVTARRLLLVAAELVGNAVRHALEDRLGTIRVSLHVNGAGVSLEICDDGPGLLDALEDGPGAGTLIIHEVVRRAGGMMRRASGPQGTRVRVVLPRHEIGRVEDSS